MLSLVGCVGPLCPISHSHDIDIQLLEIWNMSFLKYFFAILSFKKISFLETLLHIEMDA